MKLHRRWQRPFYVRPCTVVKDGAFTRSEYGEAVEYRGNIQPVKDTVVLEAYGALESSMYKIYTGDIAGINKLDGVCILVASDEPPDFEVAETLVWLGHAELLVRRVR